jgi:hypothetical protein
MRFDQPHNVQQVFLAFAGAAFRVLPGENLSPQRVRHTRHTQESGLFCSSSLDKTSAVA